MFHEICGWVGMVLIVGAYFLNTYKVVDSQSVQYLCMNLVGSAGVGINVFKKKSWSAVALQTVWIVITLFALVNVAR